MRVRPGLKPKCVTVLRCTKRCNPYCITCRNILHMQKRQKTTQSHPLTGGITSHMQHCSEFSPFTVLHCNVFHGSFFFYGNDYNGNVLYGDVLNGKVLVIFVMAMSCTVTLYVARKVNTSMRHLKRLNPTARRTYFTKMRCTPK